MSITVEQVREAQQRIKGIAVQTPLKSAYTLSDKTGRNIWLKMETMQPTGAFKIRGAANAIQALSEEQRVAAKAEERRNRKLAKQALLTGKARRRQELESLRAAFAPFVGEHAAEWQRLLAERSGDSAAAAQIFHYHRKNECAFFAT